MGRIKNEMSLTVQESGGNEAQQDEKPEYQQMNNEQTWANASSRINKGINKCFLNPQI